jgi:L-threonylcarbamoyladenylate synthase
MNTELEQSLQTAAKCVANDGVIAYPTDTVFGLGCNPFSELAVNKILRIKNRSDENTSLQNKNSKGLIILAAEANQLSDFIQPKWIEWLTKQQPQQPTTFIFPSVDTVPNWITGNRNTIAVRITAEKTSRALCLLTGAIVSTSANLQGQPPIMNSEKIKTELKIQPDYIVPGKLNAANKSSLIVDAISGKILRK